MQTSSDEEDFKSSDSDFETILRPRKRRSRSRGRQYDSNRRYKDDWPARFPWSEKFVHDTKHWAMCIICNTMEKKDCLIVPKTDTLIKHEGLIKVNAIFYWSAFLLFQL